MTITKPKFRHSGMKLFFHIFHIFLLALYLLDLDILNLLQALIMSAYKLRVLGDGGVGKSALISRFRLGTFEKNINASASSIGYFTIEEYELTYYKV